MKIHSQIRRLRYVTSLNKSLHLNLNFSFVISVYDVGYFFLFTFIYVTPLKALASHHCIAMYECRTFPPRTYSPGYFPTQHNFPPHIFQFHRLLERKFENCH